MAAAACFSKDEEDSDRCSIISDMLRFFKMGFLLRNEFDLDKPLPAGDDDDGIRALSERVWRGP